MKILNKSYFNTKKMKTWPFKMMAPVLLGAALAGLVACTTQTTSSGEVGVERKQFVALVSEAEVQASASKAYAAELGKASKANKLNPSAAQTQRVRTIANRLIAQTTAFRPDAKSWPWEVNVIDSEYLNAWCMPGGKIAIYTGLIDRLKMTDDELAAVMGHEIAHALREHARERVSQQALTGLGANVLAAGLGLGQVGGDLVNMVANVTISLPYGRVHEVEADRMGVELAARAGYNPNAAVGLWQKMAQAQGGRSTPEFLSTHPAPENRMRDLSDYAARVEPIYQQARLVKGR